ncbi:MAG: CoA-binding protein [candidate division Zixibacteria bacterium]|nr:CoA-binding protein [candidate division Zixibacteria bacterium]
MIKAAANSNVAVLGASTNEQRYSFMAVKTLKEHGHRLIVCPDV